MTRGSIVYRNKVDSYIKLVEVMCPYLTEVGHYKILQRVIAVAQMFAPDDLYGRLEDFSSELKYSYARWGAIETKKIQYDPEEVKYFHGRAIIWGAILKLIREELLSEL